MQPADSSDVSVTIRTTLNPGDLGSIVHLHGVHYSREYGFDPTFEAYVAGPLAEFVKAGSPRERLWIAERNGRIVGCVAIVAATSDVAQLRWYLVDPTARAALGWADGCSTRPSPSRKSTDTPASSSGR
jgi:hypothetical protein